MSDQPNWFKRHEFAVTDLALPVIFVAGGAIVLNGWIGLGHLCAFGRDTDFLPVGVEAYAFYALSAALRPGETKATRTLHRFAWWTAGLALLIGMIAQAMYHVMAAHHDKAAPTPVIIVVSMLPVLAIGLAAALFHMIHAAKAAEHVVREAKDRDRRDREEERQRAADERAAERQHEEQLAEIARQEREEAAERERQEREDKRLERQQRFRLAGAGRLALEPASQDESVSPVSETVSPAASKPEPPREAGAKTPERILMWDAWAAAVEAGRIPSGAELLIAAGCSSESSLGRRMVARWREIEPARSLLAKGATGS